MKKLAMVLSVFGAIGIASIVSAEEPASKPKEVETIKIFNIHDTDLQEVVPGSVSMKALAGKTLGVAMFKVQQQAGSKATSSPPHKHGEEIAIVLKAPPGGKFIAGGKEYTVHEGDVMLIPEGLEHGGDFGGAGESIVFAINSPPRHGVPGGSVQISGAPAKPK